MTSSFFLFCREDRIRTCDPLVPNQMRYRPALLPCPDWECKSKHSFEFSKHSSLFFQKNYYPTFNNKAQPEPTHSFTEMLM